MYSRLIIFFSLFCSALFSQNEGLNYRLIKPAQGEGYVLYTTDLEGRFTPVLLSTLIDTTTTGDDSLLLNNQMIAISPLLDSGGDTTGTIFMLSGSGGQLFYKKGWGTKIETDGLSTIIKIDSSILDTRFVREEIDNDTTNELDSKWTESGTNTYLTSNGNNVGIGTTTPAYKLTVDSGRLDIGYGYFNTNIVIGKGAGQYLTNGGFNNFSGSQAGQFTTTGNYNVFTGHRTGYSNMTGERNIFQGAYAGSANISGSNNTYIGDDSGYTNTGGSNNLFLGYQSGYSETGSNRLYISNSSTSSPLIYGEFDNNFLRFNGGIHITGQLQDSSGSAGTNTQILSSTGTATNWIDNNLLTVETDPIFIASAASGITNSGSGLVVTNTERTNWNTAFGWGDHSAQGYLTTDLNNYPTGLAVTGGTTKQITIGRNGLTDLIDTFEDDNTTYTGSNGIELIGTDFQLYLDGLSIENSPTLSDHIPIFDVSQNTENKVLLSVLQGLIDTDTNTQLNESQVDAFADNNGYLTSEVDGSTSNELQTISKSGSTVTLSDGGGSFTDDNTTYSPGTGLDLSGTTFNHDFSEFSYDATLLSTSEFIYQEGGIEKRAPLSAISSYVEPSWYLIDNIPSDFLDNIDNTNSIGYQDVQNGADPNLISLTGLDELHVSVYNTGTGESQLFFPTPSSSYRGKKVYITSFGTGSYRITSGAPNSDIMYKGSVGSEVISDDSPSFVICTKLGSGSAYYWQIFKTN